VIFADFAVDRSHACRPGRKASHRNTHGHRHRPLAIPDLNALPENARLHVFAWKEKVSVIPKVRLMLAKRLVEFRAYDDFPYALKGSPRGRHSPPPSRVKAL
jgi:hypothetical protein